jgi:hypothetical protein
MSTVGTVVDRTVRQLMSGTVEERNKTVGALTATSTSIVFQYELLGLRQGGVIQIDSELMYIWEIFPGSKSATVERGWNGTAAAAHVAGSVTILDPKFPRAQILEAINAEIDDLSSPMHGLFQVKSLELNYNGTSLMVNLPTTDKIIDLISVSLRYIATDYPKIRRCRLIRDLPNDDFNSGYAIRFDEQVRAGRLIVVYKTPFSNVTSESQNLQNIAGFPTTAEDILMMGAQIRLVSPREIKRNFTESQGETRRSDEVPTGSVSSSINNIIRMRRDRITAEAARLARQYPTFLSRV